MSDVEERAILGHLGILSQVIALNNLTKEYPTVSEENRQQLLKAKAVLESEAS